MKSSRNNFCNKRILTGFFLLLSVMILSISCGNDPFFHYMTVRNFKGETVRTFIVSDGDYTLPEEMEGLENILEWVYCDKTYAPGEKIAVSKDSEITAVTGIILTVDNDNGTTQPLVVKEGDTTVTLPDALGTRAGYAFDGWLVGDVLKNALDVVDFSSDMKIKAKWTVVYTVTYDANSGTGTISPDTFRADEAGVAVSGGTGFSRGTSKLASWNTCADGSGTEYKLGETYTGKADVTLYAVWRDEVTVTFDMDNGTPAETAQTITYGTNAAKPTADPTRTGYIFLGWVDKDGAVFDFDNTVVIEDITIKANWEKEYFIGDKGPSNTGYVFLKTAKSPAGYNYAEAFYYSSTATWTSTNRQLVNKSFSVGGYYWRLPSISELQALVTNKAIITGKGGSQVYTKDLVWSGDEVDSSNAKTFTLSTSSEGQDSKSAYHSVILVRSF